MPNYDGHAADSPSKKRGENDASLAPADKVNYDPTAYTAEPGAAARAAGYPRADGK